MNIIVNKMLNTPFLASVAVVASTSKIPTRRIIAILGAKRCGKDTLAKYISNTYIYKRVAFADPLKQAVSALFCFNTEQMGDGNAKDTIDSRWGITPRNALQFFGTEVMQYKIQELLPEVERKFLAYSLVSRIKENQDDCYVISDMRFMHEYEELKKLGALFIRIDRPLTSENQNLDVPVHPSEIEYRQIPFHLHINNDADIPSLIRKFEEGLKELRL